MRSSALRVILAAFGALLLVAGAAGCKAPSSAPGMIALNVTEYDLGAVVNTRPVSQVFAVRNVGAGVLEITGVSTSCGCTTADVASSRLAPGESTPLTVTYDPQVHQGETGEFVRVVYVRSNDPDTAEASLVIRVSVVEPEEVG
jgi:hypothetical protein